MLGSLCKFIQVRYVKLVKLEIYFSLIRLGLLGWLIRLSLCAKFLLSGLFRSGQAS